jgi:hypothetical protein
MFCLPLKRTFDIFHVHVILFENQELSIDKLHFLLTYVGCHLKNLNYNICQLLG